MRAKPLASVAVLLSCLSLAPVLSWADQAQDAKPQPRTERRQAKFRGMDRNGDGVITRSEWRGNDRSFRRQDVNRDGVLSGNEISDVDTGTNAIQPGRQPSRGVASVSEVFRQMDRNNDGIISRDEWTSGSWTFDRVDVNRDGVVTEPEYLGQGWAETIEPAPATSGSAARESSASRDSSARRDSRAYQAGYDRGLTEGRQAGREDKQYRNSWDLEGQRELEQADAGYDASLGSRADYQAGYRAGFRAGYRQGFGPR